MVPAILYGRETDPVKIAVDAVEMKRALSTPAGDNVLLDLDIKGHDGASTETAMVRELQKHPIKRDIMLHVDLLRISMKDKLDVGVPLYFSGEPKGAKEGGVLQVQMREVLVRCLPGDIPEYIEVPVDELDIGDVVSVADLQVDPKIELLEEPDESVASVIMPLDEEEEVEEEAVEAADVEVVGEEAEEESEGTEESERE